MVLRLKSNGAPSGEERVAETENSLSIVLGVRVTLRRYLKVAIGVTLLSTGSRWLSCAAGMPNLSIFPPSLCDPRSRASRLPMWMF
jgi:hypothetical protein